MLTEPQLAATLDGLDMLQVRRLVLVGDPRQLPPIGAGRPFVDGHRICGAANSRARGPPWPNCAPSCDRRPATISCWPVGSPTSRRRMMRSRSGDGSAPEPPNESTRSDGERTANFWGSARTPTKDGVARLRGAPPEGS